MSEWDSWATGYGYPYRGQPSVAYAVELPLGEPGVVDGATSQPRGQSSWDVWSASYGELEPFSNMVDDPTGAPGSGADRLRAVDEARLSVQAEVLGLAEPEGEDPFLHIFDEVPVVTPPGDGDGDGDTDGPSGDGDGDGDGTSGDGGASGAGGVVKPGGDGDGDVDEAPEPTGEGMILEQPNDDGSVGPVRGMRLRRHPDPLRSHTWVMLELLGVESDQPIHRYEVRESEQPIVDAISFIRGGRPARTATEDSEGSTALSIPADIEPGKPYSTTVGALTASTRHYIAVRAVDRRNRTGPITVAEITTTERRFATVTPCFIATAAYGSALAPEIGVLRRARDRYLMTSDVGRAFVRSYYAWSPALAREVAAHPWLATSVRAALAPVLMLFSTLDEEED
jgi:hypothetical protein